MALLGECAVHRLSLRLPLVRVVRGRCLGRRPVGLKPSLPIQVVQSRPLGAPARDFRFVDLARDLALVGPNDSVQQVIEAERRNNFEPATQAAHADACGGGRERGDCIGGRCVRRNRSAECLLVPQMNASLVLHIQRQRNLWKQSSHTRFRAVLARFAEIVGVEIHDVDVLQPGGRLAAMETVPDGLCDGARHQPAIRQRDLLEALKNERQIRIGENGLVECVNVTHTFCTAPGYLATWSSDVTRVIPSVCACATRMRSNGSLCSAGSVSSATACALVTGSSSYPLSSKPRLSPRVSTRKSSRPRRCLIAISQRLAALKISALAGSSSSWRA